MPDLIEEPPVQPNLRVVASAICAAVLVSGCGILPGGGDAATSPAPEPASSAPSTDGVLPEGTTQVQIEPGQTLLVSLGDGSPSVGDDWGVISRTPEDVVDADVIRRPQDSEGDNPPEPPGGSIPYAVKLTGVAPGTSTVRVLYCTRSNIEENCDQGKGTLDPPVDPVEISVTVQ